MHEASVSLEGSVQAKVAFVFGLRASSSISVFGRAKRAARERASVASFHDIPQMESLLAGYRFWMLFRLIYRGGAIHEVQRYKVKANAKFLLTFA